MTDVSQLWLHWIKGYQLITTSNCHWGKNREMKAFIQDLMKIKG